MRTRIDDLEDERLVFRDTRKYGDHARIWAHRALPARQDSEAVSQGDTLYLWSDNGDCGHQL